MGRKRIESLVGLKVLALGFIFLLHSGVRARYFADWEFGWGINIFFICSGFLIAYRYWDRTDWRGIFVGWQYVYGKLRSIWPLHIICLFLMMSKLGKEEILDPINLLSAFYNVLFLHGWAKDMRLGFSYNGATWFLSALLFCYLLAPVLLGAMRRRRWPFAWLVAIWTIRLLVYYGQHKYDLLAMNLYMNPIARLLDFACAMSVYPLWRNCKEYLDRCNPQIRFAHCSLLEIAVVVSLVILAYQKVFNAMFLWILFVQIPCVGVLAFEGGVVSWLLSRKVFLLLGLIEMEFYIFHQTILSCTRYYFGTESWPLGLRVGVCVTLTFFFAVLYRRYVRDCLADMMDVCVKDFIGRRLSKS